MKKRFDDKEYKSLKLSEEEKDAIRSYTGLFHEIINNILEPGIDNEKDFYKKSCLNEYDSETIERAIRTITQLYSALYKNLIQEGDFKENKYACAYRGTTVQDVSRLEKNEQTYRFTSATYDEDMASGYFSLNWDNPASMKLDIRQGVPYIYLSRALEEYGNNWEKEIILAPFLKLESIQKRMSIKIDKTSGANYLKRYWITLSKQELPEISEEEEQELETYLIKTAKDQYSRIIEVLTSGDIIYEKQEVWEIRLKSARRWLSEAKSEQEKKSAREDIKYIMEELERAERETKENGEQNEQLLKQIEEWKGKMQVLCMSRCRKVEKEIDRQVEIENQKYEIERKKKEEAKRIAYEVESRESVKSSILTIDEEMQMKEQLVQKAIGSQNKIKQIAENLGVKCYEYIKAPEELIQVLEQLREKIKEAVGMAKQKLERGKYNWGWYTIAIFMEEVSEEIQHHINTQVLLDIEEKQENALNKGIFDKFHSIKAEVDSSKLKYELDTIKNRGGIRRFFDKITGKEEKKQERAIQIETILKQINSYRENIRENRDSEPSRNYDIIDILADMEIFIRENSNSEELKGKVTEIILLQKRIKESLKISPETIEEVIESKHKLKMPIPIKKGTKVIQTEEEKAKSFLIDNGYQQSIQPENGLEKYQVSSFSSEIESILSSMRMAIRMINNRIYDEKGASDAQQVISEDEVGFNLTS